MATLDWTHTHSGGVTLVELIVRSETRQQVSIESELSPVWPPRRQGVALPGWNGQTFEGVVDEDDPLVVGYASPAEPVEPPATLTDIAAEEGTVGPRTLVRALGDGTPPRDAVPVDEQAGKPPDSPEQTGGPTPGEATSDGSDQFEWGPNRRQRSTDSEESGRPPRAAATGGDGTDAEATEATAGDPYSLQRVAHRLAELERRLDAVEADASTRPE